MKNTIEMYGGKIYGIAVSEYGLEKGYLDYRALANIMGDCILNNTVRDRTMEDWIIVVGEFDDNDIEQGYVDYIYYEVYNVQQSFPEVDGGMIMLTELFQNKFKSTKDAIPAVLDMAYGNESIGYIVLD